MSVAVVWTDWWPSDSLEAASRSAGLVDPGQAPASGLRVRQYYEPKRLLGKAVSASLGWEDPDADENAAWDIYLFYAPGVRWEDELPAPTTVVHQLGKRRGEENFRTGEALVEALAEAADAIVERGGEA